MSRRFSQSAIDKVADAKIKEAIADCDFDHLPGLGKPFEFDDTQYDPNWWIRRKLELEQIRIALATPRHLDSGQQTEPKLG